MSDNAPKTKLDHRVNALASDRFIRSLFFLLVAAQFSSVFGFSMDRFVDHHRVWFDCTLIGVLALVIERLVRYRLTALALAGSTFFAVLLCELRDNLTATSGLPTHTDTPSVLLAAGGILAGTLAVIHVRNRRERRLLATQTSS